MALCLNRPIEIADLKTPAIAQCQFSSSALVDTHSHSDVSQRSVTSIKRTFAARNQNIPQETIRAEPPEQPKVIKHHCARAARTFRIHTECIETSGVLFFDEVCNTAKRLCL
tara:strand:- start:44 stop:379 length:336 start_codon:yes stop_codon:yes gene_type:complete